MVDTLLRVSLILCGMRTHTYAYEVVNPYHLISKPPLQLFERDLDQLPYCGHFEHRSDGVS
jgi:hypothetical protein